MAPGRRAWSFCPSHPDGTKHGRRTLSLQPTYGLDCFAGCAFRDLVKALRERTGIHPVHAAPASTVRTKGRRTSRPGGRIVASWIYRNEQRSSLLKVLRKEWPGGEKDFFQLHPTGSGECCRPSADRPCTPADGGWSWGRGGAPYTLFRLPELLAACEELIFLVEGEKCVDALTRIDLVATTNAGGAGKWRLEYNETLRDRRVVILPNNDAPGIAHAEQIGRALMGVAASVRYVMLPRLSEKEDVVEWLGAGGSRGELLTLAGAGAHRPASVGDIPEGRRHPRPGRDRGGSMIAPTIREEHGVVTFDWSGGLTIEARHMVSGLRGVRAELRVRHLSGAESLTVGRATIALDDIAERSRLLATLSRRDGKVADWEAHLLVVAEHLARYVDETRAASPGIRASAVQTRTVRWLWPTRIPAGRLSVMGGDPDAGKSMVTCDLASRVSIGGPWPDGGLAPSGRALMITAEDNLEDTVVPRLQRHGADLERVHLIGPQECGGYVLPDGLIALEERITELQNEPGDTVYVTMDPLEVFISVIDTYRSAEVRGALAPLEGLAQRTCASITGSIHLNKRSTEATPLYRFSGSLAFVAAARSALLVAYDPEDDAELQHERRRVFINAKGNLGPKQSALAYRIVDPGVVSWEGTVNRSIYDLLAPAGQTKGAAPAREEAADFLRQVLSEGPVPATQVQEEAKQAGIVLRTLRRAKDQLGVEVYRAGKEGEHGGGTWHWKLTRCDHWPPGEVKQFWAERTGGDDLAVRICCEGPIPGHFPDDGLCSICHDGEPHQVNATTRKAVREGWRRVDGGYVKDGDLT